MHVQEPFLIQLVHLGAGLLERHLAVRGVEVEDADLEEDGFVERRRGQEEDDDTKKSGMGRRARRDKREDDRRSV